MLVICHQFSFGRYKYCRHIQGLDGKPTVTQCSLALGWHQLTSALWKTDVTHTIHRPEDKAVVRPQSCV